MALKQKKKDLAMSFMVPEGESSSPNKVKRASVKYANGESPNSDTRKSVIDTDEMQIENDRLKTSLMVLA